MAVGVNRQASGRCDWLSHKAARVQSATAAAVSDSMSPTVVDRPRVEPRAPFLAARPCSPSLNPWNLKLLDRTPTRALARS